MFASYIHRIRSRRNLTIRGGTALAALRRTVRSSLSIMTFKHMQTNRPLRGEQKYSIELRVHNLTPCSTDTSNSLFKQLKRTINFNAAARQVAIPVSNDFLKILSCTVSNVLKAHVSIATSKCITTFHAKRKPRSAKLTNSNKTPTPRSTLESEPRSVRVAPLLP